MEAKADTGNDTGQAAFIRALNRHLDTYSGVTMDLAVNAAGDRKMASYSVQQVVPGENGAEWKKIKQVMIWPDGEESEISFA
jgi:ABC-type branched-subunit amino acid transport system substrate-binding protein